MLCPNLHVDILHFSSDTGRVKIRDVQIFEEFNEFASRYGFDEKRGNAVARLTREAVKRSGCAPNFNKVTFHAMNHSLTVFTGAKPTVPCPCVRGQLRGGHRRSLVASSEPSTVLYARHPDLFSSSESIRTMRRKMRKDDGKKAAGCDGAKRKRWSGTFEYC